MFIELKKFESLSELQNLEMINLGTGMGYYDFCYRNLTLNTFNFSLPQQNLYFDYQLLKRYSYLLNKECVVCVVLPYFIFCADRLEEAMSRYERYYSLLPREDVEPYCSVPYDSRWNLNSNSLPEGDDSLKTILESSEMEQQSQETLKLWKRQLDIISFTSGEVTSHTRKEIKRSQGWLINILEYCKNMQFIPVVVVPPMSQTLLDQIGEKFRKLNFYDVLNEAVSEEIKILDYTEDGFFCNPRLYGWPGFLAEEAAKAFTKDVIKKLGIG